MTNGLGDLYKEVIIDHSRNPRNFGKLEEATQSAEGVNPLCGDELKVYVKLDGDKISDIAFEGMGCAISQASASLMTSAVKGVGEDEALEMFEHVHQMLVGGEIDEAERQSLGKLAALSGVSEFPMRVKCASLAWHTLRSALKDPSEKVTTE